jgi:hypothetical protein
MLGFDARYEAKSEGGPDIREILEKSVQKHKDKYTQSVKLFSPILFLVWIIPFIAPSWVTALN